jgi:hypothetical protein
MSDPPNVHYLDYDLNKLATSSNCSCGAEKLKRGRGVTEHAKTVHGITHRWGKPCYYEGN